METRNSVKLLNHNTTRCWIVIALVVFAANCQGFRWPPENGSTPEVSNLPDSPNQPFLAMFSGYRARKLTFDLQEIADTEFSFVSRVYTLIWQIQDAARAANGDLYVLGAVDDSGKGKATVRRIKAGSWQDDTSFEVLNLLPTGDHDLPMGIATNPSGGFAISQRRAGYQHIEADGWHLGYYNDMGSEIWTYTYDNAGSLQIDAAGGLYISPSGNIYQTGGQYGNSFASSTTNLWRVHKFSSTGTLLGTGVVDKTKFSSYSSGGGYHQPSQSVLEAADGTVYLAGSQQRTPTDNSMFCIARLDSGLTTFLGGRCIDNYAVASTYVYVGSLIADGTNILVAYNEMNSGAPWRCPGYVVSFSADLSVQNWQYSFPPPPTTSVTSCDAMFRHRVVRTSGGRIYATGPHWEWNGTAYENRVRVAELSPATGTEINVFLKATWSGGTNAALVVME